MQTATTYTIGKKSFRFVSAREASARYRDYIESRDLGASRAPLCSLFNASGEQVGYVSYNGKVWEGTQRGWKPDREPIFIPSAHAALNAAATRNLNKFLKI